MRTMYIQYSARRTYSTVHTIQYRDWIPIPRTHATQGGTKWPKVQQKTALQIKTRILAATSDRFILIVQEHGHGPAPWPMGHGPWLMAYAPWFMAYDLWPMTHGPQAVAHSPWPGSGTTIKHMRITVDNPPSTTNLSVWEIDQSTHPNDSLGLQAATSRPPGCSPRPCRELPFWTPPKHVFYRV